MKVALFANSNLWLKPYFDIFDFYDHEVWWATYELHVYNELLRMNFSNVIYVPDPASFDESLNKYIYTSPGHVERLFLDQIRPDVVITDVSNRLSVLSDSKSCLWIQAFHSFCYKRYNFHESLAFYDLLLLPGRYHFDAYLQRMPALIVESQLAITGFPKMDLLSFTPSIDCIYTKYHLDSSKKTILYAPTWGGTTAGGTRWYSQVWPRWSSDQQLEYLERLLKCYSSSHNILIKPHHFCPPLMSDEGYSLCKRYGAYWLLSDPFSFSDPFELLVIADILISDVSGIIPEFLFLDKPVIFIEPEVSGIWDESSLPCSYRCGPVVSEFDDLLVCIDEALSQPDTFYKTHRDFVTKMIFKFNDLASSSRAYQAINNLYESIKEE